ncbi:MAG: GreA/GreB family elongation factor [Curvibacter sp.]|nr:GreA/GreB family elongation factor [Curvibacter sp.]
MSNPLPSHPELRVLTELDEVRLRRLRDRQTLSGELEAALAAVFDQADLVPTREVPPDVVTMLSRVVLQSADAPAQTQVLTVAYPADAQPERGVVSVLSPLGLALLGRRVGQQVGWSAPDGTLARWRIASLDYQPEAAGHFSV